MELSIQSIKITANITQLGILMTHYKFMSQLIILEKIKTLMINQTPSYTIITPS